jgi:NAD(P)-dependent dehydrogenase (short-subunit alcohol dehydrogenase family)
MKLTPVIAVVPGLIGTEILNIIDPEVLDALRQENNTNTPVAPRFGSIDDIAQIVAFIARQLQVDQWEHNLRIGWQMELLTKESLDLIDFHDKDCHM